MEKYKCSSMWYFKEAELRNSPSRRDGISVSEEKRYRRKTCLFIEEVGSRLNMPKLCISTAQVFFHRFFMRQSFKQHDRFLVASTCVFLAGKVEESPKKLHDLITVTNDIRKKGSAKPLDPKGEEYYRLREKTLILERILLHTIAFDLCIEHPYKTIIQHVKAVLPANSGMSNDDASRHKRELAQAAWNFVNDSMRTDLCLQYPPVVISAASIYLACVLRRLFEPNATSSNGAPWWTSLGVSSHDLNNIGLQMMELYSDISDAQLSRLRQVYRTDSTVNESKSALGPTEEPQKKRMKACDDREQSTGGR